MKKKLLFLCTLAIILSMILIINETNAVDIQNDIHDTSVSINNAFSNLLVVESLGGNISRQLLDLNNASALLSEAKNSLLQGGDPGQIISQLQRAQSIANQINAEAINLQPLSRIKSDYNFAYTLLFSGVGASVFVGVLYVIWYQFKTSYNKKLLLMKPEVVEDET